VSPTTRGADRQTIAGYDAAWTRIDLDVTTDDDSGDYEALGHDPVSLYALADPEASIDSGALLRERNIPDPPYWALVWTGARAIAAVVAGRSMPPFVRVLDLGCGLGLSGLAAARRGFSVTFGDYLEEPLEFVRATLAREAIFRGDVQHIDFTRDQATQKYELILAADIVYDPAHYAPLTSYLEASLAPRGTILLTESLRADARVFLEGMAARGFADDKRALWVMEDGRRERTWLHTLQKSGTDLGFSRET
jgi:predicted nicotinamide N-methyase